MKIVSNLKLVAKFTSMPRLMKIISNLKLAPNLTSEKESRSSENQLIWKNCTGDLKSKHGDESSSSSY